MEAFFDKVAEVNGAVNSVVWGKYGLILLIGTGILMTVVTKVFQISHIGHWWKNTIGSLFTKNVIGHSKEKGTISPFQALCTALAATVGTGNIAGVAAAICIGGAGAVFWMWVAAFFGMMTNFAENVLGIYFRRKNENDEWSGGAMYYLRDGLGAKKGCKWIGKILAVLFCIFTMLASFGIGSMGQVNKIVANVSAAFNVESLSSITVFEGVSLYNVILGVLVMILTAVITLGGVKRIANVAEKIVPFMVVLYVLGSLVIIGINYQAIIPALPSTVRTILIVRSLSFRTELIEIVQCQFSDVGVIFLQILFNLLFCKVLRIVTLVTYFPECIFNLRGQTRYILFFSF